MGQRVSPCPSGLKRTLARPSPAHQLSKNSAHGPGRVEARPIRSPAPHYTTSSTKADPQPSREARQWPQHKTGHCPHVIENHLHRWAHNPSQWNPAAIQRSSHLNSFVIQQSSPATPVSNFSFIPKNNNHTRRAYCDLLSHPAQFHPPPLISTHTHTHTLKMERKGVLIR